MNIQEAKDEIVRIYRTYQKKNPDGSYRIPIEKQRPVLLIGPPGIGKTAIMKQIAEETGCGLLAYSMTHHSRQSAIGLPFISQREYGGRTYSVTEYTMSEIVASIYDYMRETGKTGGILFLDEINCVSETLTPVMLQLLQNKTFGNVPLPEGWIIVAAGNPPEYNKSVREFDMATLDRVKNMEISANVGIWLDYARKAGVHDAVRTYLSLYPDHFYNITNTDRGQIFVTARGWEDLSCILTSYEEDGEEVDASFFLQYLQHDDIARSFAVYYDLFRHFLEGAAASGAGQKTGSEDGSTGGKTDTESGNVDAEGGSAGAKTDTESGSAGSPGDYAGAEDNAFGSLLRIRPERLAALSKTECLALAAILFHSVQLEARKRSADLALLARIKELAGLIPAGCDFASEEDRNRFFAEKKKALEVRVSHGLVKPEDEFLERRALTRLEDDAGAWFRSEVPSCGEPFLSFENAVLSRESAGIEENAAVTLRKIEEAYRILQQCPQGQSSLLYFTTDLSGDPDTSSLLTGRDLKVYLDFCAEILAREPLAK